MANKKPKKYDYERSIDKSSQTRKQGKKTTSKDVPQLGQQAKQSIKPLVVLSEEKWGILQMMKDMCLTFKQVTGRGETPSAPVADV